MSCVDEEQTCKAVPGKDQSWLRPVHRDGCAMPSPGERVHQWETWHIRPSQIYLNVSQIQKCHQQCKLWTHTGEKAKCSHGGPHLLARYRSILVLLKRAIGLSPEEEVILSTLSKRLNISLYDSVFLRILAQFFSLPSFLFFDFSEFSVFTSLKAFKPLPAWASEKLAYNSCDSDQFSLTILSRIRPASDWQWMCLLQKVSPKPIKGFMAIYGLGSDIFDQTKTSTSQRFFHQGFAQSFSVQELFLIFEWKLNGEFRKGSINVVCCEESPSQTFTSAK